MGLLSFLKVFVISSIFSIFNDFFLLNKTSLLYFEDYRANLLECRLLVPNLALDFNDGNFVSTDLFSESKLLASIKGFASASGLLSK